MITISTLPFVPNYIFVDKTIYRFLRTEGDKIFVACFIEEIFASNNIPICESWILMVHDWKKHFILFYKLLFYLLWFHDAIYFIIINKCSWRHRKLQLFFLTTYNRELKKIVIFLNIHKSYVFEQIAWSLRTLRRKKWQLWQLIHILSIDTTNNRRKRNGEKYREDIIHTRTFCIL